MPKVYDQVLSGNVLLLRLLGNAKPWRSGYRMDVPIKYKESGLGGVVGLADKLDTSRTTNLKKMQFEPKMITKPVVLGDVEVEMNEGDERIIDLMAVEFDSMAQELVDELGTELYEGTGAGDHFDSLATAADDATNYATYGSLARATYTVLNGYLSTAVGALALSDLSTAYDTVTVGAMKTSLIPTDQTGFTAYEGLLQPTVRMNISANGMPQVTRTGNASSTDALGGDVGFDALAYRGARIVADDKCPSGSMFFLNENSISFHGINMSQYERPNLKGKVEGAQNIPVPRGFNWTGLRKPVDQFAEVGHLAILGNVISNMPRLAGQLQGITG